MQEIAIISSLRLILLSLLVSAFLQIPACQANFKMYDAKTQVKVRALEPWIQDLVSKIKSSSCYSEILDKWEDTNVVWKFMVTPTGEFVTFENYRSQNTSEKETIVLNLLRGIPMKAPPNDLVLERGIVVRVCKEKGKVSVFTHIGHDPNAKLAQIDEL